jgi:ubiquinone/menaquinone biosynthesis C-methylase UbiE
MDDDANRAAATGQLRGSAAEVYQEFFVPALFGQFAAPVLERAGVVAGDAVLDVGCGTGVLARAATAAAGPTGSVTGYDLNDAMLAVARRSPEPVTWSAGPAEAMPFGDDTFDRVVSQFALMFFDDQQRALSEMVRVCRPGGSITLATWADLDQTPGYAAMVSLLDRLFGRTVAEALLAPYVLGTEDRLRAVTDAVLPDLRVEVVDGTARFASLDDWVRTDIQGWTLADQIDDQQFDELLAAARVDLASFVQPDGTVRFAAPALVASATTG